MATGHEAGARQGPTADDRLSIAVFSGPTSTIQNTSPLVTSAKARVRESESTRAKPGFDLLRPQRLASPVEVYIEAFSAHPLERDAAELYGPPDGYIDANGVFHTQPVSTNDTPVYKATLRPEDGLYLLPYMARQADGRPWDEACAYPGADGRNARQTFFPDAARLFEEIDRFGLDTSGRNNLLSRDARFAFYRAAPSGGYTRGLAESERTDHGVGDIPEEKRGEDFFYYHPRHLFQEPPVQVLARVTNCVQEALDSGAYDGAIWLEGSPTVEETTYWLNLLIDTTIPICGNASQRPHGTLANDGDRNIVDSVAYIKSRIWADTAGVDRVGAVVVQDQQVFTARDVQKSDARPGGYVATGGHGGIVGTVGGVGGLADATLTFVPNKRHTASSEVNLRHIPRSVSGVRGDQSRATRVAIEVKDDAGWLLPGAMPKVTFCKYAKYRMDDFSDDPSQEVEITARIARNLERFPLAGFVLEGSAPFGRGDESMTRALERAVLLGMPVVRVGRGDSGGHVPANARGLLLTGSNLTATKARLLLTACLLRFGAPPPALNADSPTESERAAIIDHLDQFQLVFDSH